jgi:hypothetical protein
MKLSSRLSPSSPVSPAVTTDARASAPRQERAAPSDLHARPARSLGDATTRVGAGDVGGRRPASPTGAVWTQHGLAQPALSDAPQLQRAVLGELDRLVDATPQWRGALRRGFETGQLRVVAEHDRPSLGGARLLANGLLVDFAASRILGRVVDADGLQQSIGPDMKMIWGWLKSSQDDYVNEDYVEELADRYKKGDPWLEPAEVKEDGTIKDGHHRLAAQERSGTSPDFVVVDDDDKVVGQSTGETDHGKPWWSPF